jgi:hypothetical protein
MSSGYKRWIVIICLVQVELEGSEDNILHQALEVSLAAVRSPTPAPPAVLVPEPENAVPEDAPSSPALFSALGLAASTPVVTPAEPAEVLQANYEKVRCIL